MSPEVSVVIPAFNREATIGRAISSVIGQTWASFEIIVADDGSRDATVAVAKSFRDQRIRVIRHEQNRGAAAARNSAIHAARGDFVAFLDSDDEWFPEKLEVQLNRLRNQPNRASVSCTGVVLHLLDRGIHRDYHLADCTDWRRRMALGCDERPGTTLLARRAVFERVGFLDESLRRFEDWDWMLRYVANGDRILAISRPLAHIYNTRGRLGRESEQAAVRFLVKHKKLFAELNPADRRQSLCDLWLQIATSFALEGCCFHAGRMALRGLQQRPIYASKRLAMHAVEYTRLGLANSRSF